MTMTMKDIADKYINRKQQALRKELRSPQAKRRAEARREIERRKDFMGIDITMEGELDQLLKDEGVEIA